MSHSSARVSDLQGMQWLLDDFARRLQHDARAALASQDGLVACASGGLSGDDRDRLAAAVAALLSLSKGAVQAAEPGAGDTDVRQVVIEHPACLLFVMGAGRGSVLTVATAPGADPGRVGHEMSLLVQRVGEHLATPDRTRAEDR